MKNFLNHLMTSDVLLVSLGAVAGSGLQAQTFDMHAVVPFAWEANGHQLNAGDYQITKDGGLTSDHACATEAARVCLCRHSMEQLGMEHARLVFHRYGDQYFLAASRRTQYGKVSKIPLSKEERAVQSEQPREMAIVTVEIKPLFN